MGTSKLGAAPVKPDTFSITPRAQHTGNTLTWCDICHAPVVDSREGFQMHYERLGHRPERKEK